MPAGLNRNIEKKIRKSVECVVGGKKGVEYLDITVTRIVITRQEILP